MSRFVKSLTNALRGIGFVWREEIHFRIHTVVALLVVFVGMLIQLSFVEWVSIVFAILLVLSAEVLNTVIEDSWNILEPNHHPMVGKIKDMMAGYALISVGGAVVLGVAVFIHHFL